MSKSVESDIAQKLVKHGVTGARMDALLEMLDEEDGGDFLYSYPGRYVRRLIRGICHAVDGDGLVDTVSVYAYAYELLGAVNTLFEDDGFGTRISDDTMDEVDDIVGTIGSVCRKELGYE